MISLAIFIFVSFQLWAGGKCPSETTAKWPYRHYAYAKAYLYNLDNRLHRNHAIIKGLSSPDGQPPRLDKTVVGSGVMLTKKQTETIIAVTHNDIHGLIQGLSKSYIPHHGFVFYDENHAPVAYMTLCFDCEAIRVFPPNHSPTPYQPHELSDTEIKKLLDQLHRLKQIIKEAGLPVFDSPFKYEKYKNEKKTKKI